MTLDRKPYARDKKQRIAKVCEIALKVIENDSYDELSMNYIHKVTKIPIGTLYKDFPDGKEDILLEIMKNFKDDFSEKYDKFDEQRLREFIYNALDVGRKRRKLLIALQIETLKKPESFLIKAQKHASDIDFEFFKKAMEFITGRSLYMTQIYQMTAVWKALIRQHIIFRNIYGSDEEFLNLIMKLMRGLVS